MDISSILTEIADHIAAEAVQIEGSADAQDADATPGPFGIAIAMADGTIHRAGSDERFPIQSIAKVFALDLALRAVGDRVFERVGREPSGDPFDSVIDLERTCGVPRNPFINAGALVVVDLLVERHGAAARDLIVDTVREAIAHPVRLDDAVLAESQDLNRAMIGFMRHHDNVRSSADAIMDAYVRQCAIALTAGELAQAGRFLTRSTPATDDEDDDRARGRRIVLALMMTCGHYDASGDFAVRIGLPAKSGVGGGILAIAPGVASIACWSPNLDQHGNSILGVHALEMLSQRTGWTVFG